LIWPNSACQIFSALRRAVWMGHPDEPCKAAEGLR
jgi:hypothetical protein